MSISLISKGMDTVLWFQDAVVLRTDATEVENFCTASHHWQSVLQGWTEWNDLRSLSYFTVFMFSWGKIILTDQINGSSYRDRSMLFRDRLISMTGEFWCLAVSGLMKETGRDRQGKGKRRGRKEVRSLFYNSATNTNNTASTGTWTFYFIYFNVFVCNMTTVCTLRHIIKCDVYPSFTCVYFCLI